MSHKKYLTILKNFMYICLMNKFVKFALVVTMIAIILGTIEKWYSVFLLGSYWEYASIVSTALVGFIFPLSLVYIMIFLIRYVVKS